MNSIVYNFLTLEGEEFNHFVYGSDFSSIIEDVRKVLAPAPYQVPYADDYSIKSVLYAMVIIKCQKSLRPNMMNPDWDMSAEKLRNYLCKAARRARFREFKFLIDLVENKSLLKGSNNILNWHSFIRSLRRKDDKAAALILSLLMEIVDDEAAEFLRSDDIRPFRIIREKIVEAINIIILEPSVLFSSGEIRPELRIQLKILQTLHPDTGNSLSKGRWNSKSARCATRILLDMIFPQIRSFQRWRKIHFETFKYYHQRHDTQKSFEWNVVLKDARDKFMEILKELIEEIAERCPIRAKVLEKILIDGISQKTLSEITGLKYTTVRQHYFKGRNMLKILLRNRGIGPDFLTA